jgi:ABC-type Fe3+-hydroxamate transport system substrate-binding protein
VNYVIAMLTRRPLVRHLVLLGSLAILALPVHGQEKTRGPARIISLVPAVTEMLFAIGAGPRVIGVSSFDHFPPDVERLERVGALLDPNVERILALRPDLVVVYRSQTDLIAQLGRAQIPTFVYAHAGLADITSTLRDVGARAGAAERAGTLAAIIERRIGVLRKRFATGPRPKTLVVIGRDAFALRGIYASGGVGFIHDMIVAAGGDNVFADTKREAVQATSELIIARAPEIILELRGDPIDEATQRKEVQTWDTLASLPAVRNKRVRIIADARTVIPGPRVVEAVELLAGVLHKP